MSHYRRKTLGLGLLVFYNGQLLLWRETLITVCRLSSSCGKQGLLFVEVFGLLIAAASLVAEHGL